MLTAMTGSGGRRTDAGFPAGNPDDGLAARVGVRVTYGSRGSRAQGSAQAAARKKDSAGAMASLWRRKQGLDAPPVQRPVRGISAEPGIG